jgi:hypothetical protein
MEIYYDEERVVLSRTVTRFRIEDIMEVKRNCERDGGKLEFSIFDNGILMITRIA